MTPEPDAAQQVTPTTVVVGCADTASGRAALHFAAEEARLRGAVLRLVLAYEPGVDPDLADFDEDPSGLREHAERTAQASAASIAEQLGDGAPTVEVVVEPGPATTVLLTAARDAALLVIGARSEGLLARMLQGSTMAEVLHRAAGPVVVLPAPPRP